MCGTRFLWILGTVLVFTRNSKANWGSPGLGQYHIQTDEGPERYFRYQTDNGQYRKEKRLQDGTVIGTDAWIDASGFLRQKDYIADGQGYRILRSKTIFVGKDRPVDEAIKFVKNIPANAGALVPGGQASFNSINRPNSLYTSSTSTSPAVTARPSSSIYTTNSVTPTTYLGYDHYPTPQVFVRPHSQPIDDYNSIYDGSLSTSRAPIAAAPYYTPTITTSSSSSTVSPATAYSTSPSTAAPFTVPSRTFQPPYQNNERIKPIAIYPSSTPAPITLDYGSTLRPNYVPSSSSISTTPSYSNTNPVLSSTSSPFSDSGYVSSTTSRPNVISTSLRPITPVAGNSIDHLQPLYSRPVGGSSSSSLGNYRNYAPLQYKNNLGSGYDAQFSSYDGISTTRDGFRYYLPRQYQEEENVDPERRAGSFGYIDPFGIRRVIYYNTSPETGFVHRKNNRYVGFNATPYDPRPL